MENSTSISPQGKVWPERWLKKSWIRGLYQKFSLLYLQRFTGNFPDEETIEEWCEVWAGGLSGMSGDQLRHGLGYVGQHSEWPPSIAEFRAACESLPKPVLPSLERPRGAATAHGLAQIAKINEMLAEGFRPPGKWWAHDIMARVERGERLLPVQIQYAMEALEPHRAATSECEA